MNRIISPTLIALITLITMIPGFTLVPVNALNSVPTLQVDPANNAADLGQSFTVSILVSDVTDLIAYDVSLEFDNTALKVTSIDFVSPGVLIGSFLPSQRFRVAATTDLSTVNSLASLRSAFTLLSGLTTTVVDPQPLVTVTMEVIGSTDSSLNLVNTELVALSLSGDVSAVPHQVFNGAFFVPPPIEFIPPSATFGFDGGSTIVRFRGFIRLSPTALRAGFGGVRLTMVTPSGQTFIVDSQIVFFFPGQSTRTETFFTIQRERGPFTLFETILRCASTDPASCAVGASSSPLTVIR